MPVVEMPDGTELDFPDEMAEDDIRSAITSKYKSTDETAPDSDRAKRKAELTGQLVSERHRQLLPQTAETLADIGVRTAYPLSDPFGTIIRAPYELDRMLGLVPPESPNPISLPAVSPENAREALGLTSNPEYAKTHPYTEGFQRFLGETGSGMTSPEAAGKVLLGTALPSTFLPSFGAPMVAGIPAAAERVRQAGEAGEVPEVIAAGGQLAASTLFPMGMRPRGPAIGQPPPIPESGVINAETIRRNQEKSVEAGQVVEGGEAGRGGDVQQAPSGAPDVAASQKAPLPPSGELLTTKAPIDPGQAIPKDIEQALQAASLELFRSGYSEAQIAELPNKAALQITPEGHIKMSSSDWMYGLLVDDALKNQGFERISLAEHKVPYGKNSELVVRDTSYKRVPRPIQAQEVPPGGELLTPPVAAEAPKPELLQKLEAAANRARQRLDTRGPTKFGTSPDPVDLARNIADWGAIGAYRLAEAGYDVAKWSANMAKEFGDAIKPYLEQVYKVAQRTAGQISQEIESQRSDIAKILGPEAEPTPEIKASKISAYPKKQAQITVGEKTALREVLKKAEAAGAAGVESGKAAEATRLAPIMGELREKLADSITKTQALAEYLRGQEKGAAVAAKVTREDATRIDRWLAADTENIRDSLTQLAKGLPLAERGKLTSAITSAMKRPALFDAKAVETMYRNAATVAARIEDRIAQVARDDLTGKIEGFKKFTESPGIDVEYRKHIRAQLETFDRLKKADALSDDALQAFHDRLVSLRDIGRSEQTAKVALWEWQKQFAEQALKGERTTPMETRPELRPVPGDKTTFSMRLRNALRRKQNLAAITDKALLPIDADLDLIGDGRGTYKGWLFRHARGPTDLAFQEARFLRVRLLKAFEDFVKANKLTPENSNRIGVYAETQQEGGRQRLIDSGRTAPTIDRIVNSMTPTELQAYKLMRQAMDSQLPGVTALMRKLYNTEVKPVANYFPMARDWRLIEDKPVEAKEPGAQAGYDELATWKALLGDYGPRNSASTKRGFTIAREPGAKTSIRTDSFDIFRQHIQDVSYLQKMQPELKRLGEIARGDLFRQKYGDAGRKLFVDWLDTVARQGGVEHFRRNAFLDALRRNTSVGGVGFRLASQLVHLSQVPFIVARIGPYFGTGMRESFTPRGKVFIEQYFGETQERGGGEPAQVESEKQGVTIGGVRLVSPGVARASYALARNIDRINAQAAALGSYLKLLNDKGVDWQNYDRLPVDKEAQAMALVLARRSIASPLAKDVPQALSRGALTGGNVSYGRTLFQFNNVFLDQWSNIRLDFWQAGIREKNPKLAAAMFLAVLGSIAVETGIRTGVSQLTQAVTGYEPKKPDEHEFANKAIKEGLRRFPFMSMLETQLLYGETGVPSLDALLGTGKAAKAALTSTNPNVAARGAVRAVGGAAQLMGVPGAAQVGELIEKSIP